MKIKKSRLIHFIMIVFLCFVLTSINGCSSETINVDSSVAGSLDYQIMISNAGTIDIIGNPPSDYNFSDWKDIKNISAGMCNVGCVSKDGHVYVTGDNETGACDASDWHNISMLAFTLDNTYGLKNDGTIVHTDSSLDEDKKRNDIIEKWTNIQQIAASMTTVVGLKNDGTVVTSENDPEYDTPEYFTEIKSWKNIKWVSTSSLWTVGLTEDGEILSARIIETDFDYSGCTEPFDDLKGAVKVCVGMYFVAGLMPDGTVKVRSIELYNYWGNPLPSDMQERKEFYEINQEYLPDDFKAINNATDIVDINSYENNLIVLKKDGTIMVAGNMTIDEN